MGSSMSGSSEIFNIGEGDGSGTNPFSGRPPPTPPATDTGAAPASVAPVLSKHMAVEGGWRTSGTGQSLESQSLAELDTEPLSVGAFFF